VDRNFLLVIALSLVVWVVWGSFVQPPPPDPAEIAQEEVAAEAAPLPPQGQEGKELPTLEVDSPSESAATATPIEYATESRKIELTTDLVNVVLDTRGGTITRWELREFHTGAAGGEQPIVLTTGRSPFEAVLATPFDELGLGDLSHELFEVEEHSDGAFVFRLERDGVEVIKSFRIPRDDYLFHMTVRVENNSSRTVSPLFAVGWPAAMAEGQDFVEQSLAVLHEGGMEVEALQSLGVPGILGGGERETRFAGEVDWGGTRMTYFVAAMLPESPSQANARVVATKPGEAGVVQVYFDPVNLPPGQAAERLYRVYAGPKEPERLEAVGGGLVQSIDLGWFWLAPLTRFFLGFLSIIYSFVPNYGVAIILLTILVRLVTTPLTVRQMRSMERMRALAPMLQELKEKYADDRQKQSEEMMKLYRQEGVNPLGGCFPMLLQLPVFIGLFYALRSSIQLRQAPFVGWISDLSAPETLFTIPGLDWPVRLLPLVMGATMFLQQKITPMQQMDPAQQRMMLIMMPLMMTFISYTFPSGLVLYWMVSNVLAISHQLWIGRGLRT